MTNLTGHFCIVLPNGDYSDNNPETITLMGNHDDEASMVLLVRYL